MEFDKLVNQLLEQNTFEESWKHKLAIGAAALGLAGGHVKGADEGPSPRQQEAQRRIAAGFAIAKGETPAPKFRPDDQSPEAKAYRIRMAKLEAAKKIANRDYN